ncbi:fumarylacetoacetate hydrolase family protein [Roseivirga sp.]|uniref:fumarylacetoacetate hydrolase family protein n=1 Tax=Roseivirga sp. TaxID=1964215 RepID=UPI003B5239DF
MKLFRYKKQGQVKTGVSLNGEHYDVSDHINEYDRDFFDEGGIAKLQAVVAKGELQKISGDIAFDAPIYRPEKIICIGLNYRKHAEESGMEPPKEPVVFFKAPSSLTGPFDQIIIPKDSQKTDWEVELAVIVGKKASYVSEADAMDYVAGYALHNDVSEREFQLERGGQWVKGKSCDSFAPLGPYIVTQDEIPDPHNLNLWLKVNGVTMQNGNTSDFIFNIPQVISYLSRFMSLMPGDIISTGTPEGVGLGMKPPVYLKPGDVVELGIDGLGQAKQKVVAHS